MLSPAEIAAQILAESRAEAERDARGHLCDRCHLVLGIRFFDVFWVCHECMQILALTYAFETGGLQ